MIYLLEGNVPLNECYDDDIEQIANSTYQLTFKFPTSDAKWKALKEEVKLVADDLHGEQYFTIFEIVKQHGYVTVYANQAMSALNHYSISQVNVDRVAGNVVMSALAGSFVRQSPFSFFSDIMDKHTLNVSNRSAMDVLAKDKHSIIGQWGGDLVRDKYQVKLLKNGGVENESLFMYKKNMRSYQQTTSTKELRTRIHFRKKIEVGEGDAKKEQWLRVTVDSPLINKYQNIYEVDMEVQDEDVKDLASLTDYGKQYYRTTLCDIIEDSLELDVVGTGDVPVKMFDVVTVYHERFDMDMRKKITKYRYSPMGKRLKSVGFGTTQQTLGGALGSMVSDAVKSETSGLVDDFDARLEKEIENANRNFDRQKEALGNDITDGIEQAKAKAEEEAQKLRDETNQKFTAFDKSFRESSAENQRQISQAFQKAGANEVLANEAKAISSQAQKDAAAAQKQARELSKAVTKDVADFKNQVSNQLGGLATKVEVEQAEGKLVERLSQMNLGRRNLLKQTRSLSLNQRPFTTSDKYDGFTIARSTANNNNNYADTLLLQTTEPPKGTEYVLVFYARASKDNYPIRTHFFNPNTTVTTESSTGFKNERTSDGTAKLTIGTEWKRYWVKYTQTASDKVKHVIVGRHGSIIDGGDNTTTVEICAPALFEGNLVGDWVAADEDNEAIVEAAKAEFTKTAEGLSAKLTAVESYVSKDGERTEALRRYSREETARQITAERSSVSRDYVAKSSFTETVNGINRRFENVLAPVDGKIASKIAEYGKGVDGRFATITAQLNGKVNTTDFQRVKETSQLYERIIGSTEKDVTDNVARMVMTNQLFQLEVGKVARGESNSKNRLISEGIEKYGNTVTFSGDSRRLLLSETNKEKHGGLIVARIAPKKKYVLSFDITRTSGYFFNIGGHAPNAVVRDIQIDGISKGRDWGRGVVFFNTPNQKYHFDIFFDTLDFSSDSDNRFFIQPGRGNASLTYSAVIEELCLYEGTSKHPWSPPAYETAEAVRTVQSQLAGSWAVQNLTSADSVLGQLNLNKDGSVRINDSLISIGEKTYIKDGVIKNAMIAGLDAGKIKTGTLNAGVIAANSIDADKIRVNSLLAQKLVADRGVLNTLLAKEVISSYVQAVDLTANQIKGGMLKSLNGSMYFDLNNNQLTMAANDAAIRRIQPGAPTSFLRFDASVRSGQKYVATVLGSGQKEFGQAGYTEDYTKPEFSGLILENSVNTGRERFATLVANQVDFRSHFGGRGWNFNQYTHRIHPIDFTKQTGAQVWATDFVLLDPDPTKNKPHGIATSLEKLWFIWSHIIWNDFNFNNVALKNLIRDTFNTWKFRN